MELIGGEMDSEEFREVVKTIYDLYSKSDMDSDASNMDTEKK